MSSVNRIVALKNIDDKYFDDDFLYKEKLGQTAYQELIISLNIANYISQNVIH